MKWEDEEEMRDVCFLAILLVKATESGYAK
jgi:hypothetical protein